MCYNEYVRNFNLLLLFYAPPGRQLQKLNVVHDIRVLCYGALLLLVVHYFVIVFRMRLGRDFMEDKM